MPDTAEALDESIASDQIRRATPLGHSVDQLGCFADPFLQTEAPNKSAENNCVAAPAAFEHGPQDGETEIDPIHARAAVDEDAVGDVGRRDATDPIHVAVQR